jgi:hypothetical protein
MAAAFAALRPRCADARAELTPRWNGSAITVAAAGLEFLAGKPLERIQNGAALAFDFELAIWVQSNTRLMARVLERFLISYDLWEETFSVAFPLPGRRGASHLKRAAAQAWCLDNLPVPTAGLSREDRFWVRLEGRVEDPRGQPSAGAEPGMNLTALIELLSRTRREQPARWSVSAGPFRLSELRKPDIRGAAAQ